MKNIKNFMIEIFGLSSYSSTKKWMMFPFVLATVIFRRILGRKDFSKLDFVITTKCSLKCKHCSNLMQFYGNDTILAENYDTEELCSDISKLLNLADRIWQLVVVGGEPFMHKEFSKILNHLLANKNIKLINIVTNGTIVPNDELLTILKNPKIQVTVSDYGNVAKNKDKVIEKLQEYKIRYKVLEAMVWVDRGEIKHRRYTLTKMEEMFQICISKCTTLMNGKIYNCEVYSNGVNLGYIEELENEVIDIRNITRKDFTSAYKSFNSQKSIHACNYCGEVTYKEGNTVQAGIQLTKST